MSRLRKRDANRKVSKNRPHRKANSKKNCEYQQLEARNLLAAYLPGELLVQFEPQGDLAMRTSVRQAVNGQLLETVHTSAMVQSGYGALDRIAVGSGLTVEQAIARVRSLPGVRYAEPHYVINFDAISDDTHYTNGDMWSVYSDDLPQTIGPNGTTNQFGSQAEEAWANGFTGSKNVYVAVVDKGVDFNHPDLNANVWTNPFDPEDGIDNDGNGKVDDIHGWDFESDDSTVYDSPSDDHGTHVAGTIGAVGGNGQGVVGINWDVNIISTKIGTNAPLITAAISAYDYLIDLKTRHGLNIVATNNSWGGTGFSQALFDAVTRLANADILCVAAAGNSATDNDAVPHYPSSYSTLATAGYEAVISVAALDEVGGLAGFSNFGATSVDLAAPGTAIWSTLPENSYTAWDGTSMASPHVAGAAALYASAQANVTAAEIRDAILTTAAATQSLVGFTVTGARLDVGALVAATGPGISINDASLIEGNTGTKLLTFTLTLTEAWPDLVSVNYTTQGLSATSGVDYVAKAGVATFLPNQISTTVSIVVNGDYFKESNETFRVNLSSPVNGRVQDGIGIGTIINDDVEAIGEVGVITNLNSNWKTINFQRPIFDPVVIMGTPSRQSSAPITIRVRNVLGANGSFMGSFEARVDEWEYQDDIHGVERVSFMVFEAGRHVLANGSVLVADHSEANHRFTTLPFGNNSNFATAPVVLSQVTTNNEKVAVTTRMRSITKTAFEVRVQEEEAADRVHLMERVDFVAFERVRTSLVGLDFEGGQTATQVNHNLHTVNFQTNFSTAPAFFAQMQTYLGGDPCTVRLDTLNADLGRIFLEEERSADNETAHNNESVGFLALEIGLVAGSQAGAPSAMVAPGQSGSGGPSEFSSNSPKKSSSGSLASHVFGLGATTGTQPFQGALKSNSRTTSTKETFSAASAQGSVSFRTRSDAFAQLYPSRVTAKSNPKQVTWLDIAKQLEP